MNELYPKEAENLGGKYFLDFKGGIYSGIYLGDNKNPSLMFLESLRGKFSEIVVSKKAAWLFSCGRNILVKSVLETKGKGPLFLVLNEYEDVLGLVEFDGGVYNNVFDLGWYLRRELDK